jgi:CheY-like chemotaxis protein
MDNDTILVIEDDEPQLKSLIGFLEHLGFHVVSTISSVEGIKIASEQPIDLVLTDIKCPKRTVWMYSGRLKRLILRLVL